MGNFKTEMTELIREMDNYKLNLNKLNLTKNQKFYCFVFEEAFRKLFGMQIVSQMKYIKVRSPYIDFVFIENILKTKLAGIYNDFFTDNPMKRYKGQLFYAKVLQKTHKLLFRGITGKGYCPSDLLSVRGYSNIIFCYLRKKVKKKFNPPIVDNLKIVSGIQQHYNKFDKTENDFYDIELTKGLYREGNWLNKRDKFVETISYNHFVNKLL